MKKINNQETRRTGKAGGRGMLTTPGGGASNSLSARMKQNNILIFGGSGFLGKNIGKSLLSDNNNNIVIFDVVNNWIDTNSGKLKIYTGCLSDTVRIMKIIKDNAITIIFHCISCMLPDSNMENYISEIDQNFIPTMKIIDYCSHNNVKFIYLSSGGTIYGNKSGPINENDPLSPISYYGLSKKQLEEIIIFHHDRYNLNYLILRPSNPFGYGQNLYGRQGLISVLIGKILKDDPVTVFGDGTISRDYIYIDDFVFYINELIDRNISNTIINIGSGKGYTINKIISILENASGKKINVIHSLSRDNDVKSIILDISKLNKLVQHRQMSIFRAISDYYNKIIIG